ncbi:MULTISPECIES: thiamine phosphate synthase [unclassified Luteococcus]|uniref:thiamine phosphate synthase n=1 Tax=unclassified Luteococcus TaxID=2639923 RepID=UPI00313EBB78
MTALMGLTSRLKVAKLHLITDVRSRQGDFRDFVVEALRGGVDLLQVRDPDASPEELLAALEIAQSAALQLNATVVVGNDLAVAQRFGADVAHLGAADESILEARKALPEHALVGRSVHSAAQLARAQADYLLVGPVFGGSRDGVDFPGLELVREAATAEPVTDREATPWFAVGGINPSTIQQVIEAGALRVAVSSAITAASDPQAAAAALKQTLQQAWDARPEMAGYAIGAFNPGTARFIEPENRGDAR